MIGKLIRVLRETIKKFFEARILNVIDILPNGGILTLIDIGAAGEIQPRWKPFSKKLKYIGFEPDKRSRDTLNNKKNDFLEYIIYPHALADIKKKVSLYLCRNPTGSSLYEPNTNFLANFPNAERLDVISRDTLSVIPIDSLDIKDADFIKIDIQGGELSALKGANLQLERILGLELEVEFIDLYKYQPLFGDICNHLSDKGFEFIDFVNLSRWERSAHNNFGQCTFGDGLFLRVPEKIKFQELGIIKISSYFTILMIYRRYDLLERALTLLPKELASEFEQFKNQMRKVQSPNNFVRFIIRILNILIPFLGSNYRFHLIY
mgnify:CR=1 FL=1